MLAFIPLALSLKKLLHTQKEMLKTENDDAFLHAQGSFVKKRTQFNLGFLPKIKIKLNFLFVLPISFMVPLLIPKFILPKLVALKDRVCPQIKYLPPPPLKNPKIRLGLFKI